MSTVSTRLTKGGRIVIPAEFRRELGLETGDEVILLLIDGEVRIRTRREAIKQAQAIVRKHVKKGRSLVEELKRERRAEAERE
ncbi:MAG TPA: AbrB/MazE/SpoVT family DNA-binding domain-containing protein [Blastocatellia bacterium]|nr:AbrB/MazE/SpoVT family DNA-binding domain-containing protein [Blastocatellia bacterium]